MMNWQEVKNKWAQARKMSSDGCSGAPDLFWKDCCKEHDFYYRFPKVAKVSRAEADKRLRLCMRGKGSGRIVSWTYWAAVRLIGWRFWDKRK